jgi:hypothetical protein
VVRGLHPGLHGATVLCLTKEEIENWAAACAAEALSASEVCRRDDGKSGQQVRDFDLVFADGHAEPLEVTVHAETAILQGKDRIEKRRCLTANIARVWSVGVPYVKASPAGESVAYDVRRCERELPGIIERLEHAGVFDLDADSARWLGPCQDEALCLLQLGIRRVASYLPTDPGDKPMIVLRGSSGGAVHAGEITAAVEQEAADRGNQDKLAVCKDSLRRHLFVVLTLSSDDHAFWALLKILEDKMDLPPQPTLPDAITTVWAGIGSGAVFVTPPEAWQIFRPLPQARR